MTVSWRPEALAEADDSWQADALCAQTDPEAFFPEKGGEVRTAKEICRRCPVQAECLEYGLAIGAKFGIWGGKSTRERQRIARARKTARAA